jgi:hypothetical protein
MYCPECGGEYRDGFFQCADCGVTLVEEPPKPKTLPDLELVTVFETADPAELAFMESVLLDAGIPFSKRGEYLQDLFALGRIGFSAVAGPVALQVPEEHVEAVNELLEELKAEEAPEPELE